MAKFIAFENVKAADKPGLIELIDAENCYMGNYAKVDWYDADMKCYVGSVFHTYIQKENWLGEVWDSSGQFVHVYGQPIRKLTTVPSMKVLRAVRRNLGFITGLELDIKSELARLSSYDNKRQIVLAKMLVLLVYYSDAYRSKRL